jgi:lysophospholipase L1-like esterase
MFSETGIPTVFVANIPAAPKNEQDGADYWRILHMDDINDSYKRLARETDATVLSLYDLFSDYCKDNAVSIESLLCDGLHPNDAGYRVMFDLLVGAFGI